MSLREYAYETIRSRILDGTLPPGSLISEADQAARLSVSRSPVREAIQLLASEGLVEVLPKRGTLVARPSAREARESFELRFAVEGMGARLAAERRTEEHLERMRAILAGSDLSDNSGSRYERAVTFHSLVMEAAESRYLRNVFETAYARAALISAQAADLRNARDRSGDNHEEVLHAIEAADPDRAEQAMRRHLANHLERLLQSLM